MIVPVAFVIGVLLGWRRAALAGGDRMDKLQYAAVFGTIGVVLAFLVIALAGFTGLL